MNDLISIIVPVFNVENYLSRCIQSIIDQSYKHLEIILIDDGSTDSSGVICDRFQLSDSRIKVVHKNNGGLSSARNTGIDLASGNYLMFIDSDDFISPDMVSVLYNNLIKNNADISICGYFDVDVNGNRIHSLDECPIKDEVLDRNQMLHKLTEPRNWYYVVAWSKLYKKDLFRSLRFKDNKQNEDEFLIHHLFNLCDTAVTTSECLYYYVHRSNSITKTVFNIHKMDKAEALIDRYYFAKENNYTALKQSTVIALCYFLDYLQMQVVKDKSVKGHYRTICKKARFLLCEPYTWKHIIKNTGFKKSFIVDLL